MKFLKTHLIEKAITTHGQQFNQSFFVKSIPKGNIIDVYSRVRLSLWDGFVKGFGGIFMLWLVFIIGLTPFFFLNHIKKQQNSYKIGKFEIYGNTSSTLQKAIVTNNKKQRIVPDIIKATALILVLFSHFNRYQYFYDELAFSHHWFPVFLKLCGTIGNTMFFFLAGLFEFF